MATAPISRRLNLTRDQLAEFLTDQQQIRQFELLFSTVDTLQVIVGTDFEYQADTAAATANEALAQIISLAQNMAVDDAVLNAKVQQTLDAIPRLTQTLELLSLAPRQEIGTMAQQNADNVAITGGRINNTTIGATTPSTGVFTTLTGGGGSANFFQTQGAATTNAVEVKALGSDTNIAFVIDSKGTGAIDLAAGSRGVNISNGGTVTAITGTAGGSYTVVPTITISAPTTAGGVQATGTCAMAQLTSAIAGGGTGYTVGNVLSFTGGTFSAAITVTVSTVSAGVITGFTVSNGGTYTVLPTNPISVTGGTGSGATFNVTAWQVRTTAFTITNAGSGYVEQPTITFSSGSAAAYATVGSGTSVKSLGSTMSFFTAGGEQVRVTESASTAVNYVGLTGAVASGSPLISSAGSDTNINLVYVTKGTGEHRFATNASGSNIQARVAHTASAVNYVQVTGSATGAGNYTTISSQGSDSAVNLRLSVKGTGTLDAQVNSTIRWKINSDGSVDSGIAASGGIGFKAGITSSQVNYFQTVGNVAGSAPILSTQGTDTNIDLALTPKGTGNVRFGTYTASMALTIQGYVEIKDAGGTIRKLAVIA